MQVNKKKSPLPSGRCPELVGGGRVRQGRETPKRRKTARNTPFFFATPPLFRCFVTKTTCLSSFLGLFGAEKTYKTPKKRGGGHNKYSFLNKNSSI
jgi:hypothetical protein